ncbi:alpha-hydroxy acid oxidase [Amycolatopsis sp. NPDC059657]|uniref:alpha-hydroxy acid oxidase n=1 Tax=Amycolatopsis sp. NPDC059657 TaxID=3346899 RepID=UPI00366F1006
MIAKRPLCVAEFEDVASSLLPVDVWDYVQGGSEHELTLAANRADLDAVSLVPRILSDVSEVATDGSLLGGAASAPWAVAPMAYQMLAHPAGELATAAAAKAVGVPMIASTLSSCTIEEIAAVGGDIWFQLYWLRDRAQMAEMLVRAEKSGCQALVLTVDVPRMGRRLRDMRNAFALPDSIGATNLCPGSADRARVTQDGHSAVATHTASAFDPSLSWSDLDWLRDRTRLPLVIKGVLAAEDAVRAVEIGVDAVVVSNHGGRQLDGAVSSIVALPTVSEAVAGRCQVLFDSGVRGGTDVLRALALGADGVLIGRPVLWGLAVDGEQGVTRVLRLLREELTDAMALAGAADLVSAKRLRVTLASGAHGGGNRWQI